jgi:serine/threonine-protein kinase
MSDEAAVPPDREPDHAEPTDGPVPGLGLVSKLRQRLVVQWAFAYLAGAWLVFQAVDVAAEPWGLSLGVQRAIHLLLVVGFFLSLTLAWYHGEKGRQRVSASELLVVTVLCGLGGAAFVVLAPAGRTGDTAGAYEPAGGSSGPWLAWRDAPALAVLPFQDISPGSENAYFADGMHEEILTQASKIPGLIVISRTSVMRYRDRDASVPEIARELGVTAILEGSALKVGDQVRITAQLIDGRTDEHLWAESYDRPLTMPNLLAIQSEIAGRIAQEIGATLTPVEKESLSRLPTEDLEAYDLYLQGRQAHSQYRAEDNEEAIRLFKEALHRDSTYAAAWAYLGSAYAQRVFLAGADPSWGDSAMGAGRRALALEPESAEGHRAVGNGFLSQGRFRQALTEFEAAVNLDSNDFAAVNNVGVMRLRFGEFDEALRWTLRGVRLAPNLPLVWANLAFSYLALDDRDRAEREALRALDMDPENWHALQALSFLHALEGDPRRGVNVAERIIVAEAGAPVHFLFAAEMALLARDYGRAQRHALEAAELLPLGSVPPWHFPGTVLAFTEMRDGASSVAASRLVQTEAELLNRIGAGGDDPKLLWELAAVHAVRREREVAVAWLQRARRAGWRWVGITELDPILDPIRDSPEFETVLAEMRSQVEEMRRSIEEDRALDEERDPLRP